jgi:hypothetical protein
MDFPIHGVISQKLGFFVTNGVETPTHAQFCKCVHLNPLNQNLMYFVRQQNDPVMNQVGIYKKVEIWCLLLQSVKCYTDYASVWNSSPMGDSTSVLI